MANDYRFITIHFPTAGESIATGVSDNGWVVGTYGATLDVREPTEFGRRGFLHNVNTGSYQSLRPFSSIAVNANSINNAGIVVGDYIVNSMNRMHGFVYDANTSTYVDVLPTGVGAVESTISDVDESGVLMGTYSTNTTLSNPNPSTLDFRGFRAIPNGMGGYSYETFEFPLADGTFGGSRNTAGIEVGTAYTDGIFGPEFFGYAFPSFAQYSYPDVNSYRTSIAVINENNLVLGNATILSGLQVANEAFTIEVDGSGNFLAGSFEMLEIPCPTCGSGIDTSGERFEEAGMRAATNLNNTGWIVGFADSNNGIHRGFLRIPFPDGDYNLDGRVDAADYTVWRDTWGSTQALLADGDGDGTVDADDYQVWRSNFGAGVAALDQSIIAVPEPAAWVCLLLSSLALLVIRKSR